MTGILICGRKSCDHHEDLTGSLDWFCPSMAQQELDDDVTKQGSQRGHHNVFIVLGKFL